MTAVKQQHSAFQAVKLLPTIAFAFVVVLYVVKHNYAVCLCYTLRPMRFSSSLYMPILFKMRAFYVEMNMRVDTLLACFQKYKTL